MIAAGHGEVLDIGGDEAVAGQCVVESDECGKPFVGRPRGGEPAAVRCVRVDESLLEDYHVRGGDGELIPLGSFVTLKHEVEPTVRAQFQQLNSVTLSGIMAPG